MTEDIKDIRLRMKGLAVYSNFLFCKAMEEMEENRKAKEKQNRQCEVCSSPKAIVQCQFCGKWVCDKCYGSWAVARKCCGREPQI